MRIESKQKNRILAMLAILIAADVFLIAYSIVMASPARSPQHDLAAQRAQLKLLKADVTRALAIQKDMPKTKADCARFEDSLLSASAGYSAVSAELTQIGQHSGLQIASLGFQPKELPRRNMAEIVVDMTVNGDYKSVVRFLNGLQRSDNYYVIDGLSLATEQAVSGTPGHLRVALHLRSYFKNAA